MNAQDILTAIKNTPQIHADWKTFTSLITAKQVSETNMLRMFFITCIFTDNFNWTNKDLKMNLPLNQWLLHVHVHYNQQTFTHTLSFGVVNGEDSTSLLYNMVPEHFLNHQLGKLDHSSLLLVLKKLNTELKNKMWRYHEVQTNQCIVSYHTLSELLDSEFQQPSTLWNTQIKERVRKKISTQTSAIKKMLAKKSPSDSDRATALLHITQLNKIANKSVLPILQALSDPLPNNKTDHSPCKPLSLTDELGHTYLDDIKRNAGHNTTDLQQKMSQVELNGRTPYTPTPYFLNFVASLNAVSANPNVFLHSVNYLALRNDTIKHNITALSNIQRAVTVTHLHVLISLYHDNSTFLTNFLLPVKCWIESATPINKEHHDLWEKWEQDILAHSKTKRGKKTTLTSTLPLNITHLSECYAFCRLKQSATRLIESVKIARTKSSEAKTNHFSFTSKEETNFLSQLVHYTLELHSQRSSNLLQQELLAAEPLQASTKKTRKTPKTKKKKHKKKGSKAMHTSKNTAQTAEHQQQTQSSVQHKTATSKGPVAQATQTKGLKADTMSHATLTQLLKLLSQTLETPCHNLAPEAVIEKIKQKTKASVNQACDRQRQAHQERLNTSKTTITQQNAMIERLNTTIKEQARRLSMALLDRATFERKLLSHTTVEQKDTAPSNLSMASKGTNTPPQTAETTSKKITTRGCQTHPMTQQQPPSTQTDAQAQPYPQGYPYATYPYPVGYVPAPYCYAPQVRPLFQNHSPGFFAPMVFDNSQVYYEENSLNGL